METAIGKRPAGDDRDLEKEAYRLYREKWETLLDSRKATAADAARQNRGLSGLKGENSDAITVS